MILCRGQNKAANCGDNDHSVNSIGFSIDLNLSLHQLLIECLEYSTPIAGHVLLLIFQTNFSSGSKLHLPTCSPNNLSKPALRFQPYLNSPRSGPNDRLALDGSSKVLGNTWQWSQEQFLVD